jgi:hypothetical protein
MHVTKDKLSKITESTRVTDDKCRDADQSVGMRRNESLIELLQTGH